MFAHKKPEVLVVGAGPVGLMTALALTNRGVRVQIIDREPRTTTHSYALALHAASLRLLEQVGVLDRVLATAHRVRRIGVYDDTARRAELRIAELPQDYSFLAVLSQDALEGTLTEALASKGVKVQWSHSLAGLNQQAEHVDATIDRLSLDTLGYSVQHSAWVVAKTKEHHFPFVVGADGHTSTVRQRLDIDFPSVGDADDYMVYEFATDADLGDEMRLVVGEHGNSVCWPLGDGHCRWSFEMTGGYDESDPRRKDRNPMQLDAERDPGLTEARLRDLLQRRAPWFQGSIDAIAWRMAVRFPRHLAASYGRGRVWLVGDAAHVTGPVGIQSMNVGLREAMELAEALAQAVKGGGVPDLLAWSAARQAEWRSLLGLDEMLTATSKTPAWLASRKERLLQCLPASGADLALLAGQLGFDCRLPEAAALHPQKA